MIKIVSIYRHPYRKEIDRELFVSIDEEKEKELLSAFEKLKSLLTDESPIKIDIITPIQ